MYYVGIRITMAPREVIITEGDGKDLTLTRNGFSYAAIPLRILLLTYDEYRARGFNLDDSYPMRPIPADAGKSQCHTWNFCLYTILLVQAYPKPLQLLWKIIIILIARLLDCL